MIRTGAVLLALLASTLSSEASMSDRVVEGQVFDRRILGCGLVISTEGVARIRPFIETSSDVSGKVRLSVTKRSRSGTSQTSQSRGFSGSLLGEGQVTVDLPASVSVQMDVTDKAGASLCRTEQDLVLERDAAAI